MLCALSRLVLTMVTIAGASCLRFGPSTPEAASGREFNVYWNVPTFMCHKHGLYFEEVSERFGILQNRKDQFRGDQIAILYDPGMFPALLQDSNGRLVVRNGGVPQEGNLTQHLETFREHLVAQIPEQSFSGIGVIDFESWRPIFRQNWASLSPYKDRSIALVRKRHPFWDNRRVEKEARTSFEYYGKIFMDETLRWAKQYRPHADWTYYAYPYCFNLTPNQPRAQCDPTTMAENDKLSWLFEKEDLLVPSVYMRLRLSAIDRVGLVGGRVKEALRIARKSTPRKKVLPYYWYKYQDQRDTYLTAVDLESTLREISDLGADGFIIWGSSDDINTKEKCLGLQQYLIDTLGPIVQRVRSAALKISVDDPGNNQVDVDAGLVG